MMMCSIMLLLKLPTMLMLPKATWSQHFQDASTNLASLFFSRCFYLSQQHDSAAQLVHRGLSGGHVIVNLSSCLCLFFSTTCHPGNRAAVSELRQSQTPHVSSRTSCDPVGLLRRAGRAEFALLCLSLCLVKASTGDRIS